MSRCSLVNIVHNLFERRLERERFVDPNTVGSGQSGSTSRTSVGEDNGNDLGGEGAEVVVGFRAEERKKLVGGGTFGASRNQAEHHMD